MKTGTYTLAALKSVQDSGIYAGKATVQKLLYFALPADERRAFYKPYHYGPYSEAVQSAFGSLAHNEFISREGAGQYRLAKGDAHISRHQNIDTTYDVRYSETNS